MWNRVLLNEGRCQRTAAGNPHERISHLLITIANGIAFFPFYLCEGVTASGRKVALGLGWRYVTAVTGARSYCIYAVDVAFSRKRWPMSWGSSDFPLSTRRSPFPRIFILEVKSRWYCLPSKKLVYKLSHIWSGKGNLGSSAENEVNILYPTCTCLVDRKKYPV